MLDTAGYGTLNITKSVSVTVPPGVNGFITIGTNSTAVNINAGASGKVSLRGLIVEGPGAGLGNGISIANAGTVTIEDCTVRNFNEGILSTTSTALKLNVANCVARDCSYGLDVEHSAAVNVAAVATGCRLEDCQSDGFFASANTASMDVTLSDCTISGSGVNGLSASGSTTVVRVEGSRIVNNATGILTANSAQVLSRVNNTLEKNAAGNTFPGTYSVK